MTVLYADAIVGTATGTGAEGSPLSTINLAITAATAGDTIRVRGGGGRLYREQVSVTKQLTFTGYGSTEPEICGSVVKTGWTLDTGSLWYATQTTDPQSVYFVTSAGVYIKGTRQTTAAACTAAYDFAWIDASDRLYTFADADPDSAFARVEACSLTYGVTIDGVSGVVMNDIRVYGAKGVGIDVDNVTSFTGSGLSLGFGAGDGFGGQNGMGVTLTDFLIEAWGDTRPATSGAVAAEGDGVSFHGTSNVTLARGKIRDCLKAAINSIETTTTVANRIRVERCNLNVLGFHTTGTFTLRNSTIVMASNDIGGIGTFGTTVIENCGVYGASTTAGLADGNNVAITIAGAAGAATIRNTWATNARIGVSYLLGTFNDQRNHIVDNGTDYSGVSRDATGLTGALLLADPANGDYRLTADSPGVTEGIALASSFTDDIGGRRRRTLWDIGPYAYEAPPRERVMAALVAALETVGDPDEGEWETDDAVVAVHRNGLGEDGARLLPCIEVTRTAETMIRAGYSGTVAMYDRTLTVEFTYCAEGWEAVKGVGAITSDIEKALGADRTLGGEATDCFLVSNESNANGEEAAVRFTVTIKYRTSDATPTTRV